MQKLLPLIFFALSLLACSHTQKVQSSNAASVRDHNLNSALDNAIVKQEKHK